MISIEDMNPDPLIQPNPVADLTPIPNPLNPPNVSHPSADVSAPARNTEGIVEDCLAILGQAKDLVDKLAQSPASAAAYTHAVPGLYNSGVGPHLRHTLDHFDNFLAGYLGGSIDYDARGRDKRLEEDLEFVSGYLDALMTRVACITETNLAQGVVSKMDCGQAEEVCLSTVRRELQFLISHTIHHYALIAMILRHQGVEPPESFGVAPSTLRHLGQHGAQSHLGKEPSTCAQ